MSQVSQLPSVTVLSRMNKSAPRAFAVGTTGTGKSTVLEVLMNEYRNAYSTPKQPVRTLIIDTKPRFKAELELTGFTTRWSRRYSRWGYGSDVIPGSYALRRTGAGSIKGQLNQVWRLGGSIAICSTERESEWAWASECASTFYESYGASIPRLLFVDELADFYKYRSLADIFQRVARNGRERDCALIAGSQRPRKIPVEVMTEMGRLYLFHLDYDEDIKQVIRYGLPHEAPMPEAHTFYLYDKALQRQWPSSHLFELALPNVSYHNGKERKVA